MEAHVIDLGQLGIQSLSFRLPSPWRPNPEGGAIGTADMATTADVVPPSTACAVGTIFTGFTPSELINCYLNGTLAATLRQLGKECHKHETHNADAHSRFSFFH